ncbi:MAG: ferrous iron transporter B, partial [Acidobacteria bacterium]|nr:ferrous iron transporter B [Acidobacteriota bacterium]MCA1608620.1 ferrous iron transporter B [Acidobacteriota bacterium]
MMTGSESILSNAARLRVDINTNLHDALTETIFSKAAAIADGVVAHGDNGSKSTFDQKLDRILTSRLWGFPLMLLMLTTVLWLTIAGANVPSAMLADLLQGTVYE